LIEVKTLSQKYKHIQSKLFDTKVLLILLI